MCPTKYDTIHTSQMRREKGRKGTVRHYREISRFFRPVQSGANLLYEEFCFMDLDYLLLLQSFRNGIDDALTPFMEAISLFAVTYLVIVPAFLYWCVDKRSGLFTLASYNAAVAANAVVKLSACVYRPWIRDSRIIPAGDAITTATGYSFPSGHTSTATPIYGAMALRAWRRNRWISVLCLIAVFLTGFSRNYLGVHTPQDVLVAMIISVIAMVSMALLFDFLEKRPEKENYFLLGGFLLGTAALVFVTFKQYPMDYIGNRLLVDPYRMMKDGYGDIGMFMAFCLGRFIEKTWIRFQPSLTRDSLVAGLAGGVLALLIIDTAGTPLRALLGLHFGCLAENALLMLFITAIWPAVMKAVCRNKEQPAEPAEETA